MFKEVETIRGILKYRMPDILEAYDLLDAASEGETSETVKRPSVLKMKRKIIAAMGFLIDTSSIEGTPSYSDLLKDVEGMTAPLGGIADEIIANSFGAFRKKDT